VLVIEDNVDACDTLREVLELCGHDVAFAHTSPAGISKAREFKPEIVLCDIGLPGMDGFAVARAFRADDALRGAFLVALTGHALPKDIAQATEAGFDRHIAKPPNLDLLTKVLAEASRVDRRHG
jgi:two-component system CheB/CheR fusion protein